MKAGTRHTGSPSTVSADTSSQNCRAKAKPVGNEWASRLLRTVTSATSDGPSDVSSRSSRERHLHRRRGLHQRVTLGDDAGDVLVGQPGLAVQLGVEVVVDADEGVLALEAVGDRQEAGCLVDDRALDDCFAIFGAERHVAAVAAERVPQLVRELGLGVAVVEAALGLEEGDVVLPLVVGRLQDEVVDEAVATVVLVLGGDAVLGLDAVVVELVLVEDEVAVGVDRCGVVLGVLDQLKDVLLVDVLLVDAVEVDVELHVVAGAAQLRRLEVVAPEALGVVVALGRLDAVDAHRQRVRVGERGPEHRPVAAEGGLRLRDEAVDALRRAAALQLDGRRLLGVAHDAPDAVAGDGVVARHRAVAFAERQQRQRVVGERTADGRVAVDAHVGVVDDELLLAVAPRGRGR